MAEVFFSIIGFLIAFPAVAFMLLFILFTRVYKSPRTGFSRAADVTTVLLIPAVPAVIHTFTGVHTGFYTAIAVIFFALAMTYQEYRTERELEIRPLIRKIWRWLFLLLSAAYLIAFITGMVFNIMEYTGA